MDLKEVFAQRGNTQDRVKNRSRATTPEPLPEPRGTASRQHWIRTNPAVMHNKCYKKRLKNSLLSNRYFAAKDILFSCMMCHHSLVTMLNTHAFFFFNSFSSSSHRVCNLATRTPSSLPDAKLFLSIISNRS